MEIVTMNVLDIDIDLFLDPLPRRRAVNNRLSSADFHAWSPYSVEEYLTHCCNLRSDCPLPGRAVTYHHELFDIWKSLIASGQLRTPFHLTHVDSHADMGMGDSSPGYIMCELLHSDPKGRTSPKRGDGDGLLEGNFVSFAVACGWVSSIDYVHHPQMSIRNAEKHDIPNILFRDNDPDCEVIQLKKFKPECNDSVQRLEAFKPIAWEREVPIRFVERDSFHTSDSFSFAFVAQSPRYTPATSDPLFETVGKFIQSV